MKPKRTWNKTLGMVMRLYLSLDGQCQDADVCFHDILNQTSRAIKTLTMKATQAQSTPPETEREEHLWQEQQKKDKVRIYKFHSDTHPLSYNPFWVADDLIPNKGFEAFKVLWLSRTICGIAILC